MDAGRFERLSGRLERQLWVEQGLTLSARLRRKALSPAGEVVVQRQTELAAERRTWPLCRHPDVVEHGHDASTNRQRCRRDEAGGCGRTFTAITGTPSPAPVGQVARDGGPDARALIA